MLLILGVGMHAAYCIASQIKKGKKKKKKARWCCDGETFSSLYAICG